MAEPDTGPAAGGPVRVIVHAGFHKTGTSSLQDYLDRHREALAPHLAYYGKAQMPAVDAAARAYGQRPFPWRLATFRVALRSFLSDVPEAPLIVLSRESFSGRMPGQRDWLGRRVVRFAPAAIPLARALAAEITDRFGPATRVEFLYTIRDRERWLRSLYGHILRVSPLKDDFETFRARFPAALSPEAEARHIAATLAPIPVHTAALEATAPSPAGPAQAIFDLVDLPADVTAALPPARRWNVGQREEVEAEFLALNRSALRRKRLRDAKEAIGTRTHPRHAAAPADARHDD